jgi:hypothetical protein
LEFYPSHHQDEEKDGPPLYAHEVIRGCIFSHLRNFSQTVEVPAPEASSSAQQHLSPALRGPWHLEHELAIGQAMNLCCNGSS